MGDRPPPGSFGRSRPPTHGAAYHIAIRGAGLLFRALGRRLEGCQYIPQREPAVLLSNHESYLDPLLVAQVTYRPITFAAKEELFEVWRGWLFPRLNCLPVRRGAADLTFFRAASRCLRRGRLLCLFPEGTRSPDGRLQPLQPGALAIALAAGVPLIPIGLAGTRQILPRQGGWQPGHLGLSVGPPIAPPAALRAGRLPKAELERLTQAVREAIEQQRDRARELAGLPPTEV